jgi:hypothetical protein
MMGLKVCTTPYYSPKSNGMAFVKTFKRDYVYMHDFPDAKSVMHLELQGPREDDILNSSERKFL